VELVALNIGYDLGIMTPEIFAMLVIMALVTTFMTAPSLHIIDKIFKKKETTALKEIEEMNKNRILISFGKPEMGRTLLRLAHGLIRSKNGNSLVTALHLSPNNLFNTYKIEEYEKEGFAPVLSESKKLGQPIETLYKVSEDIETNIAETANNGNYNLLLMGIGQSIYKGSLLGNLLEYPANILNPERLLDKMTGREKLFGNTPFAETTRQILAKSKVPVGILVDNNLQNIEKIFLPVFSDEDAFLIEYARQFITSSSAQITVFDAVGSIRNNTKMKESLRMIEQHAPNHLIVIDKTLVENDYLKQHDLMLISLESWKKLFDSKSIWLNNVPSVLILRS
jgi:hypothetical protein